MKTQDVVRLALKLLEPLRNRVAGMVARALVSGTKDSGRLQELQLRALAGEVIDGAERFQEYGFTSVPLAPDGGQGAEAVVVFAGGGRDHPLVIAVDDRRYRLKGLAGGEVALFDDRGAKVHLTRSGLVVSDPDGITAEVGGSSVEIDSSSLTLTVGAASIAIDSASITLTAATIDLNSS